MYPHQLPIFDNVELMLLLPYDALEVVYDTESPTINRYTTYGCEVHIDRTIAVDIAPYECVCVLTGNLLTVPIVLGMIIDKVRSKLCSTTIRKGSDMLNMFRREEVKLLLSASDITKIVGESGMSVEEVIGNGARISVSPKSGTLAAITSSQRVLTIKYNGNRVCMDALDKIVNILACHERTPDLEENYTTSEESCEEIQEIQETEEESSDEPYGDVASCSGEESNTEELPETPIKYSVHPLYLETPPKKTTPTRDCQTPTRQVVLTPRALHFGAPLTPSMFKCEEKLPVEENDAIVDGYDFKIFEELTMFWVFGC